MDLGHFCSMPGPVNLFDHLKTFNALQHLHFSSNDDLRAPTNTIHALPLLTSLSVLLPYQYYADSGDLSDFAWQLPNVKRLRLQGVFLPAFTAPKLKQCIREASSPCAQNCESAQVTSTDRAESGWQL